MPNRRSSWVISPHSGGTRITPALQREACAKLEQYASRHYAGLYTRIQTRFRGALCYIDAFTEPSAPSEAFLKSSGESLEEYVKRLRDAPIHLCRLRYLSGRALWSMALYSYSSERYEPCVLSSGEAFGNIEECFALAASFYLAAGAA